MIRRSFDNGGVGLLLLVLAAGGCASSGVGGDDPAPPRGIKVETAPSNLVELPPPSVVTDKNLISVAGTVRRKPGATGTFDGHIELIVVDKTGAETDMIPLSLSPHAIPADDSREARYQLHYASNLPAGTTLRIAYAKDDANEP